MDEFIKKALILFLIFTFSRAFAENNIGNAHVLRNFEENKKVFKLLLPKMIQLKNEVVGAELKTVATFAAQYDRKNWNLFINNVWVNKVKNTNGKMIFDISITNTITSFKVHTIGPNGEVEMEEVLIEVPKWKSILDNERKEIQKRSYFITSLGYSKIDYKETALPKSEKTFYNLKIDYQLPYWNLSMGGRYTFLPAETKNSNEEVTFLDLNVGTAYTLPIVEFPWKMNIGFNIFYANVLNDKYSVGYHDLLGVELAPSIQRSFRNGDLFQVALNYSKEKFGAGLNWYHMLGHNHPIVFMFNYEKLNTKTGHIKASKEGLHFNIGYGW